MIWKLASEMELLGRNLLEFSRSDLNVNKMYVQENYFLLRMRISNKLWQFTEQPCCKF
jgi:hypothetical protein